MRINPVRNNFLFKGIKDAVKFRKDAKDILNRIDNMNSVSDYVSQDKDKNSIQSDLLDILFVTTFKVGADYATNEDNELLDELKDNYIELEEENDRFDALCGGGGHYIDRSLDIKDIHF